MTDPALWLMGAGTATPAPSPTRLTPSGPYFIDASSQLVIRRSLTAFCAPKRVTMGRLSELRAYLDWAAARGFNEVRVFSRVDWTGPPGKGVESGWTYDESACETVLTEAAQRGLRVEVTALTYASSLDDMAAHLERVDRLCQRHENAILEGANEPQVNGIDMLAVLGRYTPRSVPWASGVYEPTPYPAGPCLTYHSPRKDEWSRCAKDAYKFYTGDGPTEKFTPPYHGPVMLDEPPQVEQTIRDKDRPDAWPDVADDWRAYAMLCAFFGAGGLLHGNPGFQQCVIPSDATVLACVEAFIAGFAAVPAQRYAGYSGALQPTPSTNPGSRRYRRTGEDGRTYEVTVRPSGFGLV